MLKVDMRVNLCCNVCVNDENIIYKYDKCMYI